jgi:hypothetical protein
MVLTLFRYEWGFAILLGGDHRLSAYSQLVDQPVPVVNHAENCEIHVHNVLRDVDL